MKRRIKKKKRMKKVRRKHVDYDYQSINNNKKLAGASNIIGCDTYYISI
jgi:hypothetical protein